MLLARTASTGGCFIHGLEERPLEIEAFGSVFLHEIRALDGALRVGRERQIVDRGAWRQIDARGDRPLRGDELAQPVLGTGRRIAGHDL